MDAVSFAQWLTNLLAGAAPVGDDSIRIVVTDDDHKKAEVTFELGEWTWDEHFSVRKHCERLGLTVK